MRAQRTALADRYVVHLPVDSGDAVPRFAGTNIATGQSVIIEIAVGSWAQVESRGAAITHRNLATLIEVIESPNAVAFPSGVELPSNAVALVSELVRGRSLLEVLRNGPIAVDRAVAWTIRILEGLSTLHRRGAAHGAVSSAAVVSEPRFKPIAPVLSRLVFPPLKLYASPERLRGNGPSPSDDLWAVGVLLFEMLMGTSACERAALMRGYVDLSAADSQSIRQLSHGRELEAILGRMLLEQNRRFASAEELLESLDRWERRATLPVTLTERLGRPKPLLPNQKPLSWDPLVDELEFGPRRLEAIFDAAEQLRQAVLPSSLPPAVVETSPPNSNEIQRIATHPPDVVRDAGSMSPRTNRRGLSSIGPELAAFAERSRPKLAPWLWGLGIVAVGLAAAVSWMLRPDQRDVGAKKANSAIGDQRDLTQVARQARPKLSARQEKEECIRSYFREGALKDELDLDFVCTEEDFIGLNRKLHEDALRQYANPTAEPSAAASGVPATIASTSTRGAASGAENPALVVRSGSNTRGWQLGWYELVASAIVRQNCCREAAPIRLPETSGWCQQLQGVVRRIASDSAKVGDISPGVRSFDDAVSCLVAQGKPLSYPYKGAPSTLHKAAFQQFLKHAAEADAKRSSQR